MQDYGSSFSGSSIVASVVGIVCGVIVAVAITVGTQLAVWGNSAPTWYVIPSFIVGVTLGPLGAYLGNRWWTQRKCGGRAAA